MTRWAPVLLEPIPGSEERVVIAIAAVSEGEVRCSPTIDPATAGAVFRDDRRYVLDLIDLTTRSMREHLLHNPSLEAWPPPVESVFLGKEQETSASDVDEVVRRAAAMSSIFHAEYLRPQARTPKTTRWSDEVTALVTEQNERLTDHLSVKVHIGGHDAPAQFTFLNRYFAANLVTFSKANLKRRLEQARADLWTLSLLADGPFIFRPSRRELLTGAEFAGEAADAVVREAIDEIMDEGSRRDVVVTEFETPSAVAEHILTHAAA